MHTISFQTFFRIGHLIIVVDSWKFTMLLLYILWDDLTNSYDIRFKWTAMAAIRIHPIKAWLSQLVNFKKCKSDILEERYAIKILFLNLEKMPQKRMECVTLLLEHIAWIEHQFLSGIRDSRKAGSLWGMTESCRRSKKENTPELIGQRVRVTIAAGGDYLEGD